MNQVVIIVIVILIISLVSFVYLRKKRIHNVIQENALELKGNISNKYPSNLLPVSKNENKYTLAFSIYNENLGENSNWIKKFDSPKGIISHYGSPNVYMIPKSNTLRISIAYRDDLSNKSYYNFDLTDFKYQRWEHISIVQENRNVHIYLNGEMIKSVNLPNIPLISQNSFYLGQKNNNFGGKIKAVEYFNDSLNTKEIEKLYLSRK